MDAVWRDFAGRWPTRRVRPSDELLVTRPPGYVLAARADQIDAAQFAHLVSVASQIAANRPDEAADLLDRALGLWRGPALQEFVDEPFAMVEAARLDEMRLAATEDRFEIDLVRGEHTALVAPLGAFTADHPMRERARSQLMLALHRSSRQPEALECYRDYRELLDRRARPRTVRRVALPARRRSCSRHPSSTGRVCRRPTARTQGGSRRP